MDHQGPWLSQFFDRYQHKGLLSEKEKIVSIFKKKDHKPLQRMVRKGLLEVFGNVESSN